MSAETLHFAQDSRNLFPPMHESAKTGMGRHLREVCKQARLEAGYSSGRIAVAHNPEVKQAQTVEQWEDGIIGWPRVPDERVRAYAEVIGVEPAELWQRAIDRWKAAQAQGEADPVKAPPKVRPAPRQATQGKSAKRHREAGS